MHPYFVHLKNQYPGGEIYGDDNGFDAYDAEGKHRVALRKNGQGQLLDVSEKLGLPDRFDLSPIPKESRAFKLYADGRCAPSEEHATRAVVGKKLADVNGGKVPSSEKLAEIVRRNEQQAALKSLEDAKQKQASEEAAALEKLAIAGKQEGVV